ncbi:uncharacterized protein LOC127286540 [Leptopilina boulardi]|uniref:uncharacterized protein LOC127286540 n=1 Tax=Leptopilina boulardi TaxID=63433 RepID=UPI0021F5E44C|nr:uncharacterized protein LOC127286540 [Leptopilina boulardi]
MQKNQLFISDNLSIESLVAQLNELNVKMEEFEVHVYEKLNKLKRSIQYDIKVRFDQLAHLITSNFTSTEVAKELENLPQLPKNNILNFIEFNQQLIDNQEIKSAMKTFMRLQTRALACYKTVVSTILPMILTKEVQSEFSGFGRINYKGEKKKDFSSTETYKILKEIHLEKYPDVPLKDFNNYITRWFSNAVDREGGKKNRKSKQHK